MEKVFTVILAVLLGGCSSLERLFAPEDPVDVSAMPVYWDGPRIGPGMTLVVVVGSVTTKPVEMQVIVDQKGEITLQHLLQQPVACDGLTLEALRAKLTKEYGQFYRQPQITVNFGPYDGQGVSPWGTVRVMGEVGNPGPVNMPPTMDLTVTKVIQLAGGAKPFADKTSVKVHRCDKDGHITTTRVNLKLIGEEGRFDKDMLLKSGDVIYVPETWY